MKLIISWRNTILYFRRGQTCVSVRSRSGRHIGRPLHIECRKMNNLVLSLSLTYLGFPNCLDFRNHKKTHTLWVFQPLDRCLCPRSLTGFVRSLSVVAIHRMASAEFSLNHVLVNLHPVFRSGYKFWRFSNI